MKQRFVLGLYMAAGLLALPVAASAQSQAYTTSLVNVRAGPASDYPIVTQLPAGVPVTVMGCLGNFQWCDVAAPNLRGWVYASRLSSPYQGGNVSLMNYGAAIGLPILGFSIADYWGNYYRGRPWYNQQSRWAHHRPPPPPRPGAGRPPGHAGGPPPGHGGRPPGHAGGRPPGGPPPGNAGGRPPGGKPPGNAGGRPPGGPPPGNAGGRPPGGPPPGNAGGRPPGGPPPGNAGGRPPGGSQGGGGNRPQGGQQGGGPRPPGGGGGN
ncbi:SH3 domain-containing protein [Paraburkholderia susongensis]|uniref:Uncharacterized conserved protein YraI n=1 Tax=Paraburkholderia susongensis TaxID=1515439 RepID=A0A1X7I9V8_9BURK|nr:SH3 domain-containing protein [Paraburkholderia susongensis]SMG11451.1 Uncharacterized conserved protein YraI [Paraburkholderia susongensis]